MPDSTKKSVVPVQRSPIIDYYWPTVYFLETHMQSSVLEFLCGIPNGPDFSACGQGSQAPPKSLQTLVGEAEGTLWELNYCHTQVSA